MEDVSEDERKSDESSKEAHDKDVENRVFGHDFASLRSLLEGVDRCADLLRRCEPELEERMKDRLARV